ncbi:MAG: excinuclease ABC subunit UvrA [Spirochaetes bacterium]|nr:excinuclease ABC subunit UvrA [Spirochaetota bacterium]
MPNSSAVKSKKDRSPEAGMLVVHNAHEHNLKNISLEIPRHVLAVITGISGSGKSSLAFDTIFKEGQRRYLASLSAYARQFMGRMERPSVDLIEGLSPTICIDQKTAGRNPRSTVGTVTEVWDFMRLLYARLGVPHCPKGHGPIQGQNAESITDHILRDYLGEAVLVMAPVVRERKGEYRKELEEIEAKGFLRVRVDGTVHRLDDEESRKKMLLGRYEKHTIEVVIDRLKLQPDSRGRLDDAVHKALSLSQGIVSVALHEREEEAPEGGAPQEAEGRSRKTKSKMLLQSDRDQKIRYRLFGTARSCATCGFSVPELEPRLFSFNVPQGACPSCDGLGIKQEFDEARMVRDEHAPIFDGALAVLNPEGHVLFMGSGRAEITRILKKWKADPKTPWKKLPKPLRDRLFTGKGREKDGETFSIVETLQWLYEKYNIGLLERYMRIYDCPECGGKRLNAVSRNVLFQGHKISDLADRQIVKLLSWFNALSFPENQKPIADPILREIRERLGFLVNVGLDYLTLSRRANTLSGGEAQRIRLASQVGSGLEGCLYILDEPSIGLHQSDNKKLIRTLRTLRDRGNTVHVIEHDEETMLSADHLVDIGPAAGVHGGQVVFNGPPALLLTDGPNRGNGAKAKGSQGRPVTSITREYLVGERLIPLPDARRKARDGKYLSVVKASKNNLKEVSVDFPIGVFTCVTGVSGSGKSSLVLDILRNGLVDLLEDRSSPWDLRGLEHIDKVIELDQRPIGRTPRSNPATYTGLMDFIRDLFSQVPESRVRGYEKGRFSFNVKGGRCEECGGGGVNVVDMQLFGDAEVVCETCDGKRFNAATLDIHYKGKNIHQVLDLTCEEALAFFQDIPKLQRVLKLLNDLGMGYVKIGQPSTTLSGGEAQRIKIASELGKRATGRTVYVLDEPTTGLHFDDIRKLLEALQSLVDQGNTVVVIEHNLDVIKSADHLIELGPGGGESGGRVLAECTPEKLARGNSPTGLELKVHLERHQRRLAGHYRGARAKELLRELSDHSEASAPIASTDPDFVPGTIRLRGVRKHNLKHIDLDLPKNKLITVTGLSGSGKTSLAFETIFQEGQRKYVESLSTYARRFLGRIPRAEAEKVTGLSPTIAVDQKVGSRNPRSTLATQTEIFDSLRVLWSAIGILHDPSTGQPLTRHPPPELASHLLRSRGDETLLFLAPLYDSTSTHPSILDSPERIPPYLSALREKGYLRVEIDGTLFRLDEEGLAEKIKDRLPKIKRFFLALDRITLGESQRARLMEMAERGYDLGEGILYARDERGKLQGYSEHWTSFDSDFHFTDELTPRHFSFNHHLGACPRCQGIGLARALSEEKFIANPDEPLLRGAIYRDLSGFFTRRGQFYGGLLKRAARRQNIDIWSTPWKLLDHRERQFLLYGEKADHDAYQAGGKWAWRGLSAIVEDMFAKSESERWAPAFVHVVDLALCPECKGGRLSPAILSVRVGGRAIHEVSAMTVQEAHDFFRGFDKTVSARDRSLVGEVLEELDFRLTHLLYLGLHYLTLDRTMGSLSGGETQRVRLSTQIGNKLKDVIYVLDEPTIGLHEHETEKLLEAIRALRDRGNTVLMVEHDARMIQNSDWVVDLGPGAGSKGGEVMYSGPFDGAAMAKTSFHRFLGAGGQTRAHWRERLDGEKLARGPQLLLNGITQNNLRQLDLRLPVGAFIGISGVSGSGKSSFMDWFAPRVQALVGRRSRLSRDSELAFSENGKVRTTLPFVKVDHVDQSPVTLSMRSTAASYIEIWDPVRHLFSRTRDAKLRGFDIGSFSFNTPRGRCPACEGAGVLEIEMHFISDVQVVCDTCGGKRFRKEILGVHYKGKTIADVLAMTFQEAYDFFDGQDRIRERVKFLLDAGLGYLQLGLNTNYLSGGELQRLKLAKEISAGDQRTDILYLLDEPSTGLHLADTEMLVRILDRLVKQGNTVIVIEHNREFLRNCDWIVDLGPEGGSGGGQLVAAGTPEQVKAARQGHTWKFL